MRGFLLSCFMILASGCWSDQDGDGVPNNADNCAKKANADQADKDDDGIGDVCDPEDNSEDTSVDDTGTDDTGLEPTTWYFDGDGDGYGDPGVPFVSIETPPNYVVDATDCNDGDPDINPGAAEVCNTIDDDCDDVADEDVTTTFYKDADSDDFGNVNETIQACEAPVDYVSDASDCDDAESDIFPGNQEVCDGLDNDCNDVIDDNASDVTTWYEDTDSDGFGSDITTTACEMPTGYAVVNGDCDDANSGINPDATEVCNGLDDDCNGDADMDAYDVTDWYLDYDGDSFGNSLAQVWNCAAPTGYVADATDCDDLDATVNPDANEVCNSLDDDCNGTVDGSDAIDTATWYVDMDHDGFGDSAYSIVSCDMPRGYVADATDCDDIDASAYPGATEYCDGVDNDCDGTSDEDDAIDVATWYFDGDHDNYGSDAETMVTCDQPTGYVQDGGDCDDSNAWFNPGADESDCTDSNDYNCDGSTGFADADADGFAACEECNDVDSNAFPGATELCNGQDDDCDGVIDDGAIDASTWYVDMDHDGYGDSVYPLVSCDMPRGYVADVNDCDDSDASVNPGAIEYCNGVNDDCDYMTDEDSAVDVTTWYPDLDSDGYGDGMSSGPVTSCEAPTGYVADATDCDDTNSRVYPDAAELCDGVDNDCNGTIDDSVDYVDWFVDADGDSFGDSTTAINSCSVMSGRVLNGTDCDDSDATVNPAAEDICEDGTDQDCDGSDAECPVVPEGPAVDEDADGYSTISDCDDSDATVNPAAEEICGDDIDNDCTGGDLDCNDVDDDGDGQTENEGDCEDSDASIFTGAGENCSDGIDNDCNGEIDTLDDDCGDMVDNDGDGYAGADCDDTDTSVNPGVTEIPYNGIDENCDGTDLIDADGDGYNYTLDCDETNSDIHPDVEDVCENGTDEDCDGSDAVCPPVEPGPAVDVDADGYSTILDCDDTNAFVNPGMTEVANGVDDDCDGMVDEGTGVYDDDGDGYTEADGDCDDTDANIYPEANEYCDGVDNDCDGTVDEAAALDADLWFYDYDGDGYGDPMAAAFTCELDPENYVVDSTDCNDSSAAAFPGNPEVCTDDVDNDCNGDVDLNDDACRDSVDDDGDGYASADCDDSNPDVNPGMTEVANGVDDNCDGTVDEGTDVYDDDGDGYTETDGDCDDTDTSVTWYEAGWSDTDSDGYGQEGTTRWLCGSEAGYVTNSSDCNDSDATVNPAAEDVCENRIDEDCNGSDAECPPEPTETGDTSEPEDTGTPAGTDDDGDGVTREEGDCNDSLYLTHPANDTIDAAIEACGDGVDNDCDGVTDETSCLGSIACVIDGLNLRVTITGDVTAGLLMPLPLSITTTVGVVAWASGGSTETSYLGSTVGHEFLVYPISNFTPFASDGVNDEWFGLDKWSTSGPCVITEDGFGSRIVRYVE